MSRDSPDVEDRQHLSLDRQPMSGSQLSSRMVTTIADDDAMFEGSYAHYAQVGLSAAEAIEAALRGQPAPARILDLPCGHGRVTRVLRALYPEATLTVCDLDRSGVDFAAAQFGARGVYSVKDFRSLELGETFDLIWVGSLITHLPEQLTRRFFDFAERHLSVSGTLIVSSHGAFVADRLRAWQYGLTEDAARGLLADAAMNGYGYRSYPGGADYGISLVCRQWFEALFAKGGLQLVSYAGRGWDDHQDVLVVRRHTAPVLLEPNAYDAGGHAWLAAAEQAARDAKTVTGFDEAWYLAADPQVAAAVADGRFVSGFAHYRDYGWKEGRMVCDPRLTYEGRVQAAAPRPEAGGFDAERYLVVNPDVRAALDAGTFSSAWDHYVHFGHAEGRRVGAAAAQEQPTTP